MIITLDIFSGRPNPSWKICEKDTKQLKERVASKALMSAEAIDDILGYRGMLISAASDEQLPENVPASFRIGGTVSGDYETPRSELPSLSADEADDTVLWLLHTGRHVVKEELLAFVDDHIQVRRQGLADSPSEPVEDETEERSAERAACIIQNTPYNPGFWNRPEVMPNNNCYNYAMNYRSDTFAQPGRLSGHPTNIMDCSHVMNAATWDGCKEICSGQNKNVALVIWPGNDYHWYRRHSEGFWGHKPGGTAARNTDNCNKLINGTTVKPHNCCRGPYTVFCGYFYSPVGMRIR